MNQQQISYTQEAQKWLQYAQLISFADNKKTISHLSLFWGIYVLLLQTSQHEIFWKLVGVKNVALLDQYFHEQYWVLDFTQVPTDFSMTKNIANLIFDKQARAQRIDFMRLLFASVETPSVEASKLFTRLWIEDDVIKQNCEYIMDHPAILQIWMFAFLQLVSKLIEKLSLDVNNIQLMNIDFMQHMPVMWQGHDVLDKDENKSNVTGTEVKQHYEDKKLTVEYFSTDLTDEHKKWFLDPIIGRYKEINQIIYTLLRKTKNNPLLIGEAGVWKTAVVEWLAQKIIAGDVPEKLRNKRIMMLDMWWIVAGTKYRWEFEARMKAILEESSDPTNNIILFIDEVHSIIGAGGHENNDAAQMIKPLLARGKIMLIWATTFDEYQKHIEKDKALTRRFQEIHVDEPDLETTKQILMWLKETYENFHGVVISESAIDSAILLAKRYMLNKYFPDKAIDIIDEASARKSTMSEKLENDDSYNKLEKKVLIIEKKIESAIETQDYFAAAEFKEKQEAIKQQMQQVRSKKLLPKHLRQHIDAGDIWQVLSDKTGIPAHIVSEWEIIRLKRLKQELESHVLWQSEAVDAVVTAITRNRLSVIEKNQPIASLLFLGPSGTGKTYLAKIIAKQFFGDENALIRVDMSEFMEKYSVSKLIGSAPGYVGHEEGGLLTEQVRRKPYSVILLDEIEKASRDVLNILLQILDEWHLKDNKGRRIDFKSCIIIMTSNLWSEEFSKKISLIGFNDGWINHLALDEKDFGRKKEKVLERVKDFLSPELINRLDKIIVFKPLTKLVLQSILKLQLDGFLKQWKMEKWLSLPRFSKKKIESIVEEIYDPQYGARPLRKYIDREIEPQLIKKLMT